MKKQRASEKAELSGVEAPEVKRIRAALLAWYRRSHRDLPWRRVRDPYAIWISEIMLQQTRVDTVKERYVQFLARFPTIEALAAAPLDDVLGLWSGLGYYARARNLHAAAREVVDRYGGRIPNDPLAVRELPGIGPYTAGAILSIAFGRRAPILDGNVIRVLSRLFSLSDPPDSTLAKKRYWSLAETLVPLENPAANDPGDFNQALMELGATVCMPHRPSCLVCPLAELCQGRREGDPERYPSPKESRPVPIVRTALLVLRNSTGEVLLGQRPTHGLWGGLWEPPTLTLFAGEEPEAGLVRLFRERLKLTLTLADLHAQPLPPFVHVLTHREMRFSPFVVEVKTAKLKLPPPNAIRLEEYNAARWLRIDQPLALGLSAWVSALLARLTAPFVAKPAGSVASNEQTLL